MSTKLSRCAPCGGSGKVLHCGMQVVSCAHCFGTGKIEQPDDEIKYLSDIHIVPKAIEKPAHKRTVKYSEAKEKLRKKLRTKTYEPTDEHLEELLDGAMGKK